MKHENPRMNTTVKAAEHLEEFLSEIGFQVRELLCDPNTYGQRGATMMPRQNIPQDGGEYNLVFLFEGTGNREFHQVTTVRDVVRDPSLDNLRALYSMIWPSGLQSGLDARLLRNATIRAAVSEAVRQIAGVAVPEPAPVSAAPPEPKPSESRAFMGVEISKAKSGWIVGRNPTQKFPSLARAKEFIRGAA